MQIVIDKDLVDGYVTGLRDALAQLKASQQQAEAFRQQAEANELLTIEEACTLLKRNKVQLNHYRSLGLDYYKKGKDGVWYRRGDIVAWLESGKVNRHSR